MIRVVLTGPESSGKTELAQQLAHHFKTEWVPEYLRTYFDANKAVFEKNMPEIAQKQLENEQNVVENEKKMIFLDTNILTLKIYHKLYFKSKPDWFKPLYNPKIYDHYLLLKPDIPWIDDGQRDMPERREELFYLFEQELLNTNSDYTIIEGDYKTRLQSAIQVVEKIMGNQ